MRPPATCALALALTALGCVHYQPRPISPDESLAAFSARTLADPGLRAFLAANRAEVPDASRPWGLATLTLAAFYFNPDLDVARAELAAARAGAVTAGARENPAVALSAGYDTTTPVSLVSPWVLGFNLDVPLTTAGKRAHRVAQARNLVEVARFNLAAAAWQVRSRVRASLVELRAATESDTLLRDQEAIERTNAEVLERQLEAGAVSPAEVTQAHLALASARVVLADAGARLAAARAQLAESVGVPVAAVDGAPLSTEGLDEPSAEIPTAEARRHAVLNRADVLGALAEYAASQAALQLEIARQYPDIHLGPGYEFDQGNDKWFLALSLPLPVVNRNRGPIAEAEAARAAAAARFTAVQAHAVALVDQAAAAYGAARAAAEQAGRAQADLGEQERAAQARFDAGEISRLELGGARLERVAAALVLLDARTKAATALGQLEDAMQTPSEPLDRLTEPPRRV
ncbi:MAG TPA: TolC family protein, partial [Thermoanaerobaculaceae bacterium]|nr:TolC family protein [Thermoanaerobaculaceae bacterium]